MKRQLLAASMFSLRFCFRRRLPRRRPAQAVRARKLAGQLLRSHAGHPTLVHFWGVTCGPCKVELPLLGQFMKDHPAIDVVTISADLVPDLPGAARSMLEKAGLVVR